MDEAKKMILIREVDYKKLLNDISIIVKKLDGFKPDSDEQWLSADCAKQLLGFRSKSKLQQLRDSGEIIFSKHGRIIKYSKRSILEFLERNLVK